MEPSVVDNPAESRFEIRLGDEVAGVAKYREQDGKLVFFHTEVSPEFGGQGLGGKLARGVLEAMRDRGELIVPECEFIAGYISDHPEYDDVVDPGAG